MMFGKELYAMKGEGLLKLKGTHGRRKMLYIVHE